jgi:hypothetical protein
MLAGVILDVDRTYYRCLAYAKASNEPTCVYGGNAAVGHHKNGDADDPQDAELTCCPNTADSIANKEGSVSSQTSLAQTPQGSVCRLT